MEKVGILIIGIAFFAAVGLGYYAMSKDMIDESLRDRRRAKLIAWERVNESLWYMRNMMERQIQQNNELKQSIEELKKTIKGEN